VEGMQVNTFVVPKNVTEEDKEKAKEEIKTYLDKIRDVTSSKEKFEEYLSKNDINTFNASWIAASYFAQKLDIDSAILEEINTNINNRAKELGYEVKEYDLEKLEGKHIEEIRSILKTDFGAEPFGDAKFFEGLKIDTISDNIWNSILNSPTSVAATGGTNIIKKENKEENKGEGGQPPEQKQVEGGQPKTPTEGGKEHGNGGGQPPAEQNKSSTNEEKSDNGNKQEQSQEVEKKLEEIKKEIIEIDLTLKEVESSLKKEKRN
jgi:hypothetical protein